MTSIEEVQLHPDVESEVEIITRRARDFAGDITQQGREADGVHDAAGNEYRVRLATNFMIAVCDFMDSTDHQTTTEIGGTDSIQDFAHQGRVLARRFFSENMSAE